jgi:hypothetical protein
MNRMAEPTGSPGERRLAHPPSDRYKTAEPDRAPEGPPPGVASLVRGLPLATVAGLIGAAVITWLGGVLTVTAGLVVVAAASGWAIGASLRRHRVLAVSLTVLALGLGQAGLWAYGRSEGGVLAPLDYLSQVYGGLVPLEFAAGSITAWIAAR